MRKVIALALLIATAGCGDSEFRGKFETISHGMTQDEVVKIMGSPGTEIAAGDVPVYQTLNPVVTGSKILEWKKDSPTHRILVGFDDDKVVSKWQWFPEL